MGKLRKQPIHWRTLDNKNARGRDERKRETEKCPKIDLVSVPQLLMSEMVPAMTEGMMADDATLRTEQENKNNSTRIGENEKERTKKMSRIIAM